ncbi:MAG TPA: PIN domain-containing protein [Terriglobales bacterium]|jgi:predicted nucleic acid-binding protein|nr:PIN domain-containing protein [Terriglobales bacterium]
MNAIADTGYLVALLARQDENHAWAVGLAAQLTLPLLTCEAVLAETAFHLKSSVYVLAMLRQGAIRVAFDCSSHVEQLQALATHYADRNPDLADLCLIRMSELYPEHAVVTVDEDDFRVYRRNKREAIPLLCPPRR